MVQNMLYFIFFDQVQGDNGDVFVKKSSVDSFNEERDYHGEIKSYWSNTVCRKFIKSFQRKHRLLYIFFSPVNIPSYSPEKYTFVFVQKKQKQNKTVQNKKTIEFLIQAGKLLL